MMEVEEIAVIAIGIIIPILGFFLKRVMAKVDHLDRKKESNTTEVALIKQRLKAAEQKLDKHHSEIGAQQIVNSEFKILFAEINGTLNQINSTLQDLKG